jgi:hypothetical protein
MTVQIFVRYGQLYSCAGHSQLLLLDFNNDTYLTCFKTLHAHYVNYNHLINGQLCFLVQFLLLNLIYLCNIFSAIVCHFVRFHSPIVGLVLLFMVFYYLFGILYFFQRLKNKGNSYNDLYDNFNKVIIVNVMCVK